MGDEVRAPTAAELALIHERRARDRGIRLSNELAGPRSVGLMAAVSALVCLAAMALGLAPPIVVAAGVMAAFCGVLAFSGRRAAMARLAARPGRWDAPDGEWRVHTTRIQARSVVYAASEDEDYITWVLFEIPGGEWAALDDLCIPPSHRQALACADLTLTWLEPSHECIAVECAGEPLPRHGALRLGEPGYDGDDFAQAIEGGFGWGDPEAYEKGIDPGEGPIRRVAEDTLPEWMRTAVKPR